MQCRQMGLFAPGQYAINAADAVKQDVFLQGKNSLPTPKKGWEKKTRHSFFEEQQPMDLPGFYIMWYYRFASHRPPGPSDNDIM
jgi:hypothetical protein